MGFAMCSTHDTAGPESGTVHNQCVQLNFAFAVQKAATAGVEGFVIFHNDYSCFGGVESRAALVENLPSGSDGVAHAYEVRVHHVVGNGPGPAVHE
jgi:hypothetical protein